MYISRVRMLMQVVFFISVTNGDWQVINDEMPIGEFNLQEENLLPAEPLAARLNKGNQRSLAYVNQHEKHTRNPKKDLKIEETPQHPHHSVVKTTLTEQSHITAQGLTASHGNKPQKSLTGGNIVKKDDDVDIINEGFLLVDSRHKGISGNNRKLTQFVELFTQEIPQTNPQIDLTDVHFPAVEKSLLEARTNNRISEEGLQRLSKDSVQQEQLQLSPQSQNLNQQQLSPEKAGEVEDMSSVPLVTDIDASDLGLKLACINQNIWGCLMFKEDYTSMRNSLNLSSRASAKERKKRQAPSNIGNRGNNTIKMSQDMTGCESNDCFSGNPPDLDEEEVVPKFLIKAVTKVSTNLTNADLDNKKKTEIAKKLEDQLNEIFKDIPGFKNATVDPSTVSILDGKVVAQWVVSIDGGNPILSGMNGKDVRDTIEEPLKKASDSYKKNVTLEGKHPEDAFNSTEAADQVELQAKDPCKMIPSPCSKGFGSCRRLPDRGKGIELKCMNNCKTYGTCQNKGICEKDLIGTAYCQCSENWLGLYCDKFNGTTSPTDQQTAPEYKFKSTTTFNTTLTPGGLTPEMFGEISKNFTQQLNNIFKDVPGFKNVTVNSIKIKDGQLIVDWEASFDPTVFARESPDKIGDIVRDALQNVSDEYKRGIVIGNQIPLHDFDYVDAANQIEFIASDPCNSNPCTTGYGNCRAHGPTTVECIHNCNAFHVCQNGGTCNLNPGGEAFCQCKSRWSGNTCTETIKHIDGGKIIGIVLGSILIAAGVLGCIFWFFCCRHCQRKITFTTYTDEEASESSSAAPCRPCVIERPSVSISPLPIFMPSSNISPPSPAGSSQGSDSSNVSRQLYLGRVRNPQERYKKREAPYRYAKA